MPMNDKTERQTFPCLSRWSKSGAARSRNRAIAATSSPSTATARSSPISARRKRVTYLRSSAKPLQAVPLVASGAADHFGFTEQEIAVACASHNGEPIHTETVAGMLAQDRPGRERLKMRRARAVQRGSGARACASAASSRTCCTITAQASTRACSRSRFTSARPPRLTINRAIPLQLMIGRTIAQFSGVPLEDIAVGVDGCGVPVFGVTVRAMALMYARLVAPPADWRQGDARGLRSESSRR